MPTWPDVPFAPIAIVGRGCALPGALDPQSLWDNVSTGRRSLSPLSAADLRMPRGWAAGGGVPEVPRGFAPVAGMVRDFDEAFDATGFRLDATEVRGADPALRWALHACRAALREAGHPEGSPGAGLVLGNLGYPWRTMAAYAERTWLAERAWWTRGTDTGNPRRRFCTGMPVLRAARALGLDDGLGVEAACASSLYAIKLACDRLHDGTADLMLAGGLSGSDPLFIATGFHALGALSPSGLPRPFHRDADGLVPSEGAAVVALMRLPDAERSGLRVHGVIRGIGLSGDGRAGGFLVPSRDGQVRAMRAAYRVAGIDPATVSLLECHATGTRVGDAIEVGASAEIFAGATDLVAGSVKAELGHLLTAAGAAGLLKLLGAMRAGVRPAAVGADAPVAELDAGPLRLPSAAEPWPGLRRAAISAFGFGGANAHLIVDSWDRDTSNPAAPTRRRPAPAAVAVIAVGARIGDETGFAEFSETISTGDAPARTRSTVDVALAGLRFPPKDLGDALAQQTLVLAAAREATDGLVLPSERSMVLVGMECDPEAARDHARWRSGAWAVDRGDEPASLRRATDMFGSPLTAARVTGTMANIVANRIGVQLDLTGPGFAVCASDASGWEVLHQASRALREGEADVVLAGAVDLSAEPVHSTAVTGLGLDEEPGDAAVVLVLKRLADARRDGDPILATLEESAGEPDLRVGDGEKLDPVSRFGSAHAARFLVSGAAAIALLQHGLRLDDDTRPVDTVDAVLRPLEGPTRRLRFRRAEGRQRPARIPSKASRDVLLPAHPPTVSSTRTAKEPTIMKRAPALSDAPATTTGIRTAIPPARTGISRPEAAVRPGPRFDRSELEFLATGRISELLGPMFAVQDGDARQTRMPRPPMLLADRVTGIDAEPGSMGTGTIWTRTDLREDAWYIDHTGRMHPGMLIEAGQADLLLISWLGADLRNRGRRVYRLLGCEVMFHAAPPVAGQVLDYEIRIIDHAEHGGTRLFFFEYDCRADGAPQLSIRGGQAGFFTDAELSDSGGVLWDPRHCDPPAGTVAAPAVDGAPRRFDAAAVRAFAEGRPYDCFGPAWKLTRTHVRSPRIAKGQCLLLGEVTEFDPVGGPWGRGYLRAETPVRPDDWFFDGHFQNDPCMPGTMMLDGCIQAVSFHLAAMGYTVDRDGWRFEPVPERPYRLRCRGQVTPASRRLVYEVFVSEVTDGPQPTVRADVLVTVDGLKAVHAEGLAVRLVADWPLDHWRSLAAPAVQRTGRPVPARSLAGLAGHVETRPVAAVGGHTFGYASMLASSWGRHSDAFPPVEGAPDDQVRTPRLPSPPYHFMSRIRSVDGPYFGMKEGSRAHAEYDVPDEAWYFTENDCPVMPLAVLMETALQPCGWLALYAGCVRGDRPALLLRNLDGDAMVFGEVTSRTKRVSTRVELTGISDLHGMMVTTFGIECEADGMPLLRGTTVMGYFSAEALAVQAGLPTTEEEHRRFAEPCDRVVDLRQRPARYFDGPLRMPGPMLMRFDQVTGYWPEGGPAGLGRLRAVKDVDPDEWFFKSHFFQDPVMPGSLGVQAAVQLLQFYAIDNDLGAGLHNPRFEGVAVGESLSWKYRGQIRPTSTRFTIEAEVLEVAELAESRTVYAQLWLWVDGRRSYHLPRIGIRVVAGDRDMHRPPHQREETA